MPNVAVSCEDERGRVSSLFVLESEVIVASCSAWHGREEGGRDGLTCSSRQFETHMSHHKLTYSISYNWYRETVLAWAKITE